MRKRIKLKIGPQKDLRSYGSIIKDIKQKAGDISESKYLSMSEEELMGLPAEDKNGICFYEVGEILLGKEALLRFVKNYMNYGR